MPADQLIKKFRDANVGLNHRRDASGHYQKAPQHCTAGARTCPQRPTASEVCAAHTGTGGNKSLIQMKIALRYSKYNQVFIERFSSSSGDVLDVEEARGSGQQLQQHSAQDDIISRAH